MVRILELPAGRKKLACTGVVVDFHAVQLVLGPELAAVVRQQQRVVEQPAAAVLELVGNTQLASVVGLLDGILLVIVARQLGSPLVLAGLVLLEVGRPVAAERTLVAELGL
jgi:hypothetical protein